jgi:hypothetical protein
MDLSPAACSGGLEFESRPLPAILNQVFHDISQSLSEDDGTVIKIGHNGFLALSVYFPVHHSQSHYCLKLYG